jgi:hypothetical protein
VEGQLRPSKRPVSLRGLNRNHNHDLKNIFKGAAIIATSKAGPFQEFYAALVATSAAFGILDTSEWSCSLQLD